MQVLSGGWKLKSIHIRLQSVYSSFQFDVSLKMSAITPLCYVLLLSVRYKLEKRLSPASSKTTQHW